jgi:hypothetical protein
MGSSQNYSEVKLNGILNKAIDEFKGLMKFDDSNKWRIPDPKEFRYIHSFKGYDSTSGGILILGLNPHTFGKGDKTNYGKKKDEKHKRDWIKNYCIDKGRNTSDCLLARYPYFKLFTADSDHVHKECSKCPVNKIDKMRFSMNLREIDPNIKFTDAVLIKSGSKEKLIELLSKGKKAGKVEADNKLQDAIDQGWKTYLSEILKLIRPTLVVCNSSDLSHYIEEKLNHQNKQESKGEELKDDGRTERESQTDVVNVKLSDGISIPFVLSGQVTGQRATDKWALMRLRCTIERTYYRKG